MKVWKIAGALALALSFGSPGVALASAPLTVEQTAQASTLASDLAAAINALGPDATQAQVLAVIEQMTAGKDIGVVAAALSTLSQNSGLSTAAAAAVSSANQAAQLALNSSSGSSGATGSGSGSPAGSPASFGSSGGTGAPGGGGGSGYTSS